MPSSTSRSVNQSDVFAAIDGALNNNALISLIQSYLNDLTNNGQIATEINRALINDRTLRDEIDIDAIIARLASIDAKTITPTSSQPAKITLPGFTSIAAINNNLLDASGLGAWTDVRAYQSIELTLVASASGFAFTRLQGSVDNAGTNATFITTYDVLSGVPTTFTSIAPGTVLKLKSDLTGVNFIRIGNASAVAGNKISAVLNTLPIAPQVAIAGSVAIAGTVPTSITGTVPVTNQIPQPTTDATGVVTATTISAALLVGLGQSYQSTLIVSSITGALARSIVRIQESPDSGNTWRTVYTFEPITIANGARTYKSALITSTGNRIRYVETITGTTPSISRSIIRSAINALGIANQDVRSQTIYNANLASIDVPAYGVIRAINALTTLATPLWLQLHDSIAPVVPGAQPRVSIRIPVDGLRLGSDYFGQGKLWGGLSDPRITISTSANGYTQISQAANTVQLFIEAI